METKIRTSGSGDAARLVILLLAAAAILVVASPPSIGADPALPVETPAPPVETPALPFETPAPPVETPAPPVETPAPPVETPTPDPTPAAPATTPPATSPTPTPDPTPTPTPASRTTPDDSPDSPPGYPSIRQAYDLDLSVRVATGRVDVVETIRIENTGPEPLRIVNLSVLPRALRAYTPTGAVTVDGRPATASFTNRTNLQVVLDPELRLGDAAVLRIPFRLTVRETSGAFSARLNRQSGILTLGNWFPIVSTAHDVYGIGDPQVSFDAETMRIRVATDRSLPRNAVAATGTLVAGPRTTGRRWTFEAHHVRDAAVSIAPAFRLAVRRVGGTEVRVYAVSVDPAPVAKIAADAFARLQRLYGPYGYRSLAVVEAGAQGFSMEFPTVVLMSRDGIEKRSVLAHEIAHQWFYGLLGNDQIEEPWVDEAFAVFSSAAIRHKPVSSCASRRIDLPIHAWPAGPLEGTWFGCSGIGPVVAPDGTLSYEFVRPETRCPNPAASCNAYFETVYLRGAVFLQELRSRMGDVAFFGAVRKLIAAHRHGLVTGQDVLDHLRAGTGKNLEPVIARFTSR